MFKRRNARFYGVSSPSPAGDGPDEAAPPGAKARLQTAAAFAGNPILVLGVFALGYLVLGYMFFQAYQRDAENQSAIEAGRDSLREQPADPDALRAALGGWQTALEAADEMRVQPQFDSSILAGIMNVAEQSGTTVISAGLLSDSVTEIADSEYLATPIRLRIRGALDVLHDFVGRLEGGAIEALEVQQVDITRESTTYSAEINVSVFSQPDDLVDSADKEVDESEGGGE